MGNIYLLMAMVMATVMVVQGLHMDHQRTETVMVTANQGQFMDHQMEMAMEMAMVTTMEME